MSELEAFVRRMPKVELHIHLEGSIQPRTLLRLAERRRVSLPATDEQGLREWFDFRDFEHFVQIYLTCCECLRDPEDFQLVARELLAEQSRQNVLCFEAHLTIGTHLANGVNGGEVADALGEVIREGEQKLGIRMRLIPDIVRNLGPSRADQTLEWALDHRQHGVVALGLSGFESESDDPFAEHFQVAAKEALGRVAHAGEHAGPESIRSVLEVCGVERVGHGISAVEDPELMEKLCREDIPLEVCPTSNIRLGAVADLPSHPFDRLLRAGVPVTLSTDDPPFFDTTLTDEYLRVAECFGYGESELAAIAGTALRKAFVTDGERQTLENEFRRQLSELGEELLGAPVDPALEWPPVTERKTNSG
ncbi:MAG: adenosine deaminase [Thermoanaerobaculia bacterium]